MRACTYFRLKRGDFRKSRLLFRAHSGNLLSFPLSFHACTSPLSRPLFRRRGLGRVLQPFHCGRRSSRRASSTTPAWRTRLRRCSTPALFDGDENAIVDFKYSSDPHLTWWFDHHQSAFLSAAKTPNISARDTSGRKLYDPSYKSCTAFIRDIAKQVRFQRARSRRSRRVGATSSMARSIRMPKTAVELGAPAMKLTLVIEAAKGSGIVQRIIGWMQRRPLAEIIAEPEMQALYEPLYQRHLESVDIDR